MSMDTAFRESVETLLRSPSLPVGIDDNATDGPDAASAPIPSPKQSHLDEFCAEDLAHLFADWYPDLSNRHHAEAFGRKVAEAWKNYAARHEIATGE